LEKILIRHIRRCFYDEAKCVAFSKSSENEEKKYINILDDEEILGKVCLEPYGIVTLEEKVIC